MLNNCSNCGLLFLDEKLLSSQLENFYPSGYWWLSGGLSGRLERFYREWMVRSDQLRFTCQVLNPVIGLRLLDIGCGSGTFVKMARQAGLDAMGLEISPEALKIARKEVSKNMIVGSEKELLESNLAFDAITLFHSLEHMTEPFQFLKRLKRLLKPEGSLIVQVPNAGSLQARIFGSKWYGLDCPRHLYNYTLFSLFQLLGGAGFRVRSVRYFSLRDNAAAIVSSMFPFLDPMSNRVKRGGKNRRFGKVFRRLTDIAYFLLLCMAQPLAIGEALIGRGGTLTVWATLEKSVSRP